MNYLKIKAPFLSAAFIKNRADLFRRKYWDDSFPVEIEDIIELKLKLDIIPVSRLQKLCDTDALITSDWLSVYVDSEKYLDNRYKNRLRFSLAHEIGHFILHRGLYNTFGIKNIEDFYKFIELIPLEQYSYFEIQANKFASYLLVPREELKIERENLIKHPSLVALINSGKLKDETINSYLANPISKIFGVSEEVIEIALNEILS